MSYIQEKGPVGLLGHNAFSVSAFLVAHNLCSDNYKLFVFSAGSRDVLISRGGYEMRPIKKPFLDMVRTIILIDGLWIDEGFISAAGFSGVIVRDLIKVREFIKSEQKKREPQLLTT